MSDTAPIIETDRPLIRAVGGAICVLATLLQRSSKVSADEVGDILALYATVTVESDADAGLILAFWAGMLKDIHIRGAGDFETVHT